MPMKVRKKKEWEEIARLDAELGEETALRRRAEVRLEKIERAREYAQDALELERRQMLSIFSSIDEVIYVADPQSYEILYVNGAAERHWGDCLGKKCYEALQGRTTPCPFCTNDRIFGRDCGKPCIWEFRNEKTGRWFRCIDRAILWPDGRMVRLEVAVDITESKRSEEERRELETQVRNTQKLESLGLLASGAVHDFNNLLTGILGNVDLSRREIDQGSPAQVGLDAIETTALRAAELCSQMLSYSGRGPTAVGPVDLNAVVDEMARLLEVSISKKVVLLRKMEQNLPTIEADASQIRQVVLNLISNASESFANVGGVIRITTREMACSRKFLSRSIIADDLPEGRYVCIEVADTGCGMTREQQGKIFDPFFTTKTTGRGLGLATVIRIVREQRGAILVDGVSDRGTTFQVLFPARAQPAPQKDSRRREKRKTRGSGTILLVDDEPGIREVGRSVLGNAGFRVITAVDGKEALRIFRKKEREIACVVLDLTMPNMDGRETFDAMRCIRGDVPVIFSSGYSDRDLIEKAKSGDIAGFLQKPYSFSDFVALICDVLHGARESESLPAMQNNL